MSSETRIRGALVILATEKPVDKILLVDIAERASVSLPSVRKHVGGKKGLVDYMASQGIETFGDTRNMKHRILDAARSAFSEGNFNTSSLDDVAQHAGVTKGAIYHHFKNKDALLLALSEQRIWRYLGSILAISGESESAWTAERFELICRKLWEDGDPGDRVIPLVPSQLRTSPDIELRRRIEQIEQRVLQFFSTQISTGQQDHAFPADIDPDAAAILLWSVMQQLDHLYQTSNGKLAFSKTVQPLMKLLARALLP